MVDRADAGRQEQPFRRMDRRFLVEDDGARRHQRMAEAFLDVPSDIRATGVGRELACGQGRRDRNHARSRRVDCGTSRRAVSRNDRSVRVELLRCGDAVPEAQSDHLRRVGDRPATQRHQQIGAGLARRIRRRDDIGARSMRADPGAEPGKAIAKHLPQSLDEVGLTRQSAARENEDRARIEAIDLLRQRFGIGFAEDDASHRRKAVNSAQHHRPIGRRKYTSKRHARA